MSLTRLVSHLDNRPVAILTAFRKIDDSGKPRTKNENEQALSRLENDIRSRGYGYTRVDGYYIENKGTPQEVAVKEASLIVVGDINDKSGNLKGAATEWGRKYGQDCILFKEVNQDQAVLIGTRASDWQGNPVWPGLGTVVSIGKFHPMGMGDLFTKMKHNKTFTFETVTQQLSVGQIMAEMVRRRTDNGLQ